MCIFHIFALWIDLAGFWRENQLDAPLYTLISGEHGSSRDNVWHQNVADFRSIDFHNACTLHNYSETSL